MRHPWRMQRQYRVAVAALLTVLSAAWVANTSMGGSAGIFSQSQPLPLVSGIPLVGQFFRSAEPETLRETGPFRMVDDVIRRLLNTRGAPQRMAPPPPPTPTPLPDSHSDAPGAAQRGTAQPSRDFAEP